MSPLDGRDDGDDGDPRKRRRVQRNPDAPTDDNARRRNNSAYRTETRGAKPKISWAQIHKMDKIIEEFGMEARQLSWESLAYEAGIEDVCARTVQRAMGTMGYRQCVACRKGWCNPSTAKDRIEFAKIMLQRYPEPDDWKPVRFSDEVHFGYGPSQTNYIIRKPGQRYCADCIAEKPPPEQKSTRREHAWAAIGFDFKSDIMLYDAKSPNGKMSHEVYVNQILEPVVKKWLQRGDVFVLEEDGDSGHGGRRHAWNPNFSAPSSERKKKRLENPVQTWKRQNGLQFYFNCHNSPDLSPIENCWQGPKSRVKKVGHFDKETTQQLIFEGWEAVSQEHINKRCLSMPQRLRDVIERDGQMTGW